MADIFDELDFSAKVLNEMFVKSAAIHKGSVKGYEAKLNVLLNLCRQNILTVKWADDIEALEGFIESQRQSGYPIPQHSARYKKAYAPHYRTVLWDFIKYIEIFMEINSLLKTKSHVVVGIDGKCGAGKTTLAEVLSNVYDCQAVRMDDFFLPGNLRTDERLSAPGGNVHYERFLDEVMPHIGKGQSFSYRRFDCKVMDYAPERKIIDPSAITVVEGSYCMRPELEPAYDLKVFLDISETEQKNRIIARNGAEAFKQFESRWIPMENRYFDYYDIANKCPIIL